eukprot:scaffold15773_cov75-Cyclotella_meneghiniana.AAC.5
MPKFTCIKARKLYQVAKEDLLDGWSAIIGDLPPLFHSNHHLGIYYYSANHFGVHPFNDYPSS